MATKQSAVRGAQSIAQTSSTNASCIPEVETQEATPYSQALSRLEPLQPILAGLAHRNHNQHRRAAWWRHFGMLRRNCAKLVESLVVAIAAARKTAARAAKAAKAKSKKRRREELASGGPVTGVDGNDALGVQGDEPEAEVVAGHAAWLYDVLAPKCYLSFSQLTADNQFAPLGVVLLGILAQVKAACDCVAPRPAETSLSSPSAQDTPAAAQGKLSAIGNLAVILEGEGAAAVPASEPRLTTSEGPREKQKSRSKVNGEGEGKTISREDVERAAEQHKKGHETGIAKAKRDVQSTPISDQAKASTPIKETVPITSSKRQVLSGQAEGDEGARPTKKMKVATVAKENGIGGSNENVKNKKKKKAKKGNEFDDLFKGLF